MAACRRSKQCSYSSAWAQKDFFHWAWDADRDRPGNPRHCVLPSGVDQKRGEPQLVGGVPGHGNGSAAVRNASHHRGHLPAAGGRAQPCGDSVNKVNEEQEGGAEAEAEEEWQGARVDYELR